ncbi:MAG: PPK2 family polyphosphate kinase [Myxococcota bacterium]
MGKKKGRAKGRLGRLDMDVEVASKDEYEEQLKKLQLKMLRIQQAYFHQKRRAVIVFEGWDAAGKGGAIRRLTETLDPRGFHVWPVGKPAPEEQGRHYLWRFWQRLPVPGGLAVFDRSWYGRVLVERVEKFCGKEAWKRAYEEINEFERMLVDDGARVVKIFMHITPEEQLRRFQERLQNPYKQWKITEEDLRNRARWQDYVAATEDMFARTDTKAAPWFVVPGNRKWYARLRSLEIVTKELSRGVDIALPPLDPRVQAAAAAALGLAGKD